MKENSFVDLYNLLPKKTEKLPSCAKSIRSTITICHQQFNADMKMFNVIDPVIRKHTSRYIFDVIYFIEKLISIGYAYQYDSSIYFDITKFIGEYPYPQAKIDGLCVEVATHEQEETITTLTSSMKEKKSVFDFPLWKKSDEPGWSTQWGFGIGRPAWDVKYNVFIGIQSK